jgi:hypothetical protein
MLEAVAMRLTTRLVAAGECVGGRVHLIEQQIFKFYLHIISVIIVILS